MSHQSGTFQTSDAVDWFFLKFWSFAFTPRASVVRDDLGDLVDVDLRASGRPDRRS